MGARLFDHRMHDGSRHFGELPETPGLDPPEWDRLRDAVSTLPDARLESFVCDEVTEAWIELELWGHRLSINNQHGLWWFFVADPECPDTFSAWCCGISTRPSAHSGLRRLGRSGARLR